MHNYLMISSYLVCYFVSILVSYLVRVAWGSMLLWNGIIHPQNFSVSKLKTTPHKQSSLWKPANLHDGITYLAV